MVRFGYATGPVPKSAANVTNDAIIKDPVHNHDRVVCGMSDSLLASVTLGLARKPLGKESLDRASQLLKGPASQPTAALALAAQRELHRRASLPSSPSVEREAWPETLPAHPYPKALVAPAQRYLEATTALSGRPDFWWFWHRRKVVPASAILLILEHEIRKQRHNPRAYALLGARGVHLGALHPRYRAKCTYIATPQGEGTALQRSREAAHHLGLLGQLEAVEQSTALLTARLVDKGIAGPLADLLLSAFRQNTSCVRCCLVDLLVEQTSAPCLPYVTTRLLGETPEQPSTALGQITSDIDAFTQHAGFAIASDDAAYATQLLKQTVLLEHQLYQRHPLLPGLFSLLNAEDFAALSTLVLRQRPGALSDPIVERCFRQSGYPLSLSTSTALIDRLHLQRGYQIDTAAIDWIAQLNLQSIDYLLELIHDTGGSPKLDLLLQALTARQQMGVASAA